MMGVDIEWSKGINDAGERCLIIGATSHLPNGKTFRGNTQTIPQSTIDGFKNGLSIFDIIEVVCEPYAEAQRQMQAAAESASRAVIAAQAKRHRKAMAHLGIKAIGADALADAREIMALTADVERRH